MGRAKTGSRAGEGEAGGEGRAALDPRKRPRQERAALTVAAILEAAAQVLESRGLDDYTTNAVAERAGVSIGSLYQYFPNKTALTRALIAREDAALLGELEGLLREPGGLGLLAGLVRVAARQQLRRPVLARLLDAEELRLPPGEAAGRLPETLHAVFRHCLGEARIGREPYLTQDLFAIIHGMVDVAGERGERDAEALAARIERAVLGYIKAAGNATGGPA